MISLLACASANERTMASGREAAHTSKALFPSMKLVMFGKQLLLTVLYSLRKNIYS